MSIKFLIIILTCLLIYDTYHEHYYFKLFKTYKKYYKMLTIGIIGIGLVTILGKKNGTNEGINILNNFIKILPIDTNTKSMAAPFISHNVGESKILKSGKQTHKRSVGETKKKYVASQQQWKCGDCGDSLTAWFEVDHKQRLDRGGNNEISNLVALCRNCHGKKTALENM